MEIVHSKSRKCATLLTAVALVVSGVAFSSAAARAEEPQAVVETPAGIASEDVVSTETGREDAPLDSAERAEEENASSESEPPENDETQLPADQAEDVAPESGTAPATRPAPATPSAPPASQSMTTSASKASPSLKVTSRSKSKITAGKKIVVKGKASSSLKKKIVKLQIKSGKKWRTVATSRVQSDRTFRLSVQATQAGPQKYRVAHSATSTTKSVATKAFGYTVWKWYSLAGKEIQSYSLNDWDQFKSIGGKYYKNAASFGWALGGYERAGWAEYNVNYRCSTFKATIGVADASTSGAQRNFTLRVDDLAKNLGDKGIGRGTAVTEDISGSFRIRIGSAGLGNSTWGMGTFGSPRVFCSKAP